MAKLKQGEKFKPSVEKQDEMSILSLFDVAVTNENTVKEAIEAWTSTEDQDVSEFKGLLIAEVIE